MDFEQNIDSMKTPDQNKRSDSMALASLILGIIAIVTSGCIYLAIVCGALGIILALLSRGGEMTFTSKGIAGLTLSSIGLALTILMLLNVSPAMPLEVNVISPPLDKRARIMPRAPQTIAR